MDLKNLFLGGMTGNIAGMTKDNYNDRKIANKISPEDNNGIGVSTIYASDINQFETALLDKYGTHPVEHYYNKQDAILGHEKWILFAKSADGKKVTKLGFEYDDCGCENEEIILNKLSNKSLNLTGEKHPRQVSLLETKRK